MPGSCWEVIKMKKKITITLKEFIYEQIKESGIDAFKHQFGVTESCVYQWARSHTLPRAEALEKIVKLSKGRLCYQEIIESFNKKQTKNK